MLNSSKLRLYAINGKNIELTSGPQTAFGRRIVQLSAAYDEELLDDQTVVHYLEELSTSCECQLDEIERIGHTPDCAAEHDRLISFLDGLLQLADDFDQFGHQQICRQVEKLEDAFTVTLCALTTKKAA